MTIFGDTVFKEVIKVNQDIRVETLSQHDGCSYKKRKFGHRCLQKLDHMKTQDSHLQAKERGFRRSQHCFLSWTPHFQICEKIYFSSLSHSVYFIMTALGN